MAVLFAWRPLVAVINMHLLADVKQMMSGEQNGSLCIKAVHWRAPQVDMTSWIPIPDCLVTPSN